MHTFAVIAEVGSGELPAPHDVAMDDQGGLMVADTVNNRVAILELYGVTGRLVGVSPATGSDGQRECFRGVMDAWS